VSRRSRNSQRDACGSPVGGRRFLLAGRFALRLLSDQHIDKRVDRFCLRKIDTALKSRLDETSNDLCPADRFAMLQTDVDGEAIEIGDVTVQQYDGDLCPGLGVDDRPTSITFDRAHTLSSLLLLGFFRTG